MPSWTHLIRFVAEEDNQSHIGQLVDTGRDVGLDSFEGRKIKAYLISGTIFDGAVTKTVLTVKYVSCYAHTESSHFNTPIAAITGGKGNMQLYSLLGAEL